MVQINFLDIKPDYFHEIQRLNFLNKLSALLRKKASRSDLALSYLGYKSNGNGSHSISEIISDGLAFDPDCLVLEVLGLSEMTAPYTLDYNEVIGILSKERESRGVVIYTHLPENHYSLFTKHSLKILSKEDTADSKLVQEIFHELERVDAFYR